MKVQKRVAEFVGFEVVKIIAQVLYFAGLSALIPLVPLLLSPQEVVAAKYAFGIALGFIFGGFVLMYWFSESKKVAFRALGLMTLIPGLLAVVFSFMGPRRMTNFLGTFGEVTPFFEQWVETYVPKAWLLAGVYIIVGVFFMWISEKVRK